MKFKRLLPHLRAAAHWQRHWPCNRAEINVLRGNRRYAPFAVLGLLITKKYRKYGLFMLVVPALVILASCFLYAMAFSFSPQHFQISVHEILFV